MINRRPSHMRKAQSAMEYLMTYGWAILIIAVVLAALFSLGVFSGGANLGTACIASSGFLCSQMSYSHTTGLISLTLGQNTGQEWYTANVMFVPQGVSMTNGVPSWFVAASGSYAGTNTMAVITNWVSGQQLSLNTNTVAPYSNSQQLASTNPMAPTAVGASTGGAIWVAYTTSPPTSSPAPTVQYQQIASLTAKAT